MASGSSQAISTRRCLMTGSNALSGFACVFGFPCHAFLRRWACQRPLCLTRPIPPFGGSLLLPSSKALCVSSACSNGLNTLIFSRVHPVMSTDLPIPLQFNANSWHSLDEVAYRGANGHPCPIWLWARLEGLLSHSQLVVPLPQSRAFWQALFVLSDRRECILSHELHKAR